MPEQPPTLRGYNFTPDEARKARVSGQLLSMRTELTHACNYRCVYCNEGLNQGRGLLLQLGLIKDVICQVKDLGAVSVVIIGGGEPLLYPDFHHLVCFVCALDLIPVIFTNGSFLDRDIAAFLFNSNASVLVKLDSMREVVQDHLAGRSGAYKNSMSAISNLLNAGYD